MTAAPSDTALCRDCRKPIRWGETSTGKRAPFDSDGSLHFRTCEAAPAARNGTSTPPLPVSATDREARLRFAIATAASLVGQFAQSHAEVRVEHVFTVADKVLAWFEQQERPSSDRSDLD